MNLPLFSKAAAGSGWHMGRLWNYCHYSVSLPFHRGLPMAWTQDKIDVTRLCDGMVDFEGQKFGRPLHASQYRWTRLE
jgi:hypothetical protein